VSIFVVGIMMSIVGIIQVINAFQVRDSNQRLLSLFLGALYIIAGLVTFESPLLAAQVLTIILGAALITSGVVRIVLAFSMKEGLSWIWIVVSGVITFCLGILILARWPASSVYALGLFLGIDMVFAGAGWIGLGLGVRAAAAAHQLS